jgi:hypothetical protein
MTQQGLRQASARNLSGFATGTNYNEDFLRLFDAQGVAAGTFNERQLRWINARMGATFTNLDEAMQAYATGQGVYNWSSLGALEDTANFTRVMPYGTTYTRTGAATGLTLAGIMQAFAADAPQRTDRGLVIEAAATNRALYSTDASNADWDVGRASKTPGQADPFGGTNAALITASGVAGSHFSASTSNSLVAYTSGETYSFSRLVKKGTQSLVQLSAPSSAFGAGQYANFDLDAGTYLTSAGVVGTPTILAIGDGWYQISMAVIATATASGSTGAVFFISTGADTRGPSNTLTTTFFDFGAQQVAGAAATSLIPTTSAAVTRGLPIFTESVPVGRTKALLAYADDTTTLVTDLTPGDTFEYDEHVIAAGKGRFGVSELVSRVWQA